MILYAIGESGEYFADVVVVVIDTHLIRLNGNAFFNFNFWNNSIKYLFNRFQSIFLDVRIKADAAVRRDNSFDEK